MRICEKMTMAPRLLTAFFGMGTGDQNRNSIGTLVRLLMPQQAT